MEVAALLVSTIAVSVQAEITPEQFRDRGVLLYVPFNGSTDAAFAVGQRKPLLVRDVLYTNGIHGQGVQLLCKPSRYVKMPGGKLQKYKTGQSVLTYNALGNLYSRQGTLAFWVLSPWEAANEDLLTGANLSGPCVIGIGSKAVYPSFFSMTRRKSFFDSVFGGSARAGGLSRFGTYGQKLIPLWKKDTWHHVAATWSDRRGYSLYLDGEAVYGFDGDIEWDLVTPTAIALGSRPPRAGNMWPAVAEYVFDDLITFGRPLSAEEIELVKTGRFAELRATTPADWPADTSARRRSLNLDEAAGLPVVKAALDAGAVATFRQWPVEEVVMNFHRRFALVDGSDRTAVRFSDGGLPFDIRAVFRSDEPRRINHVIAVLDDANGSYLFEKAPQERVKELSNGRNHLSLPDRERGHVGVFFKGNSVGKEISFFDVRAGVSDERRGTRYTITGTVRVDDVKGAPNALVRAIHPDDGQALYAPRQSATKPARFQRRALRHLFVVLAATAKDRFVDALRLHAPIKPARKRFAGLVRLHDPLIADRAAFSLDLMFEWPEAGKTLPLDLTLGPPGLVIPAGGSLVLDLILDTDFELAYGDGTDAYVEIVEGDPARIGHEFAQAQVRAIWDGYISRLSQNRFALPGENNENNPIWVGLSLAEKYDPGNEQVQAWFGWSRLRPWPAYDFSVLNGQPGPAWAVHLREAVQSMQTVIHWWLDNRSNEDAYLVGSGNQWNDITKLYNKYLCLGALAGDTRLVDAVERYLDAHWNSGRMNQGFTRFLTDMLHAAEEASFIQPSLNVLRPGVPRHLYRDLSTARNYGTWMGRNEYGHTHFKSSFVTATRMLPGGARGRDHCGCATATVPGRYLWWYNGHPPTAKILTAHAKSWLEDTLRATKEKPAGIIPAEVQFETDKLFNKYQSKPLILDMFAALYGLTDDDEYLEPFRALLRDKIAIGGPKWALTHSLNYVQYRILTGDTKYDEQLRSMAAERYDAIRADDFHQRGIEVVEGQTLFPWIVDHRNDDLLEILRFVIRNNRRSFFAYCPSDPPTDRVYPWGRAILPVVMLGGRLFDGRAADPLPSAAFLWEGIDTDVVSMVFERAPSELKMLVYNFKAEPVKAGLRAVQLPEGRYRLATALDKDGDRKPDAAPDAREVRFRRFTPTPLTIPSRQPLWVELKLLKKRPAGLLPDLAVTLAEPVGENGRVLARIHNLGCVPASNVLVRLMSGAHVLAEGTVPALPGLTSYAPSFIDVPLTGPKGGDPSTWRLAVDPQQAIEEINEANNTYPLSQGVPPPVESAKGKP